MGFGYLETILFLSLSAAVGFFSGYIYLINVTGLEEFGRASVCALPPISLGCVIMLLSRFGWCPPRSVQYGTCACFMYFMHNRYAVPCPLCFFAGLTAISELVMRDLRG